MRRAQSGAEIVISWGGVSWSGSPLTSQNQHFAIEGTAPEKKGALQKLRHSEDLLTKARAAQKLCHSPSCGVKQPVPPELQQIADAFDGSVRRRIFRNNFRVQGIVALANEHSRHPS